MLQLSQLLQSTTIVPTAITMVAKKTQMSQVQPQLSQFCQKKFDLVKYWYAIEVCCFLLCFRSQLCFAQDCRYFAR